MKGNKFRTRARLIQQLGLQLIKNEGIALLELVKNSYDADASFCTVEMNKVNIPQKGSIVITDDGEGMDDDILRSAWLEIGTSHKEELASNPETKRTDKFKRLRLGEKGIGRLGVHRLGKFIKIITKRGEYEYVLEIDWDKFEQKKYIEDVEIVIKRRTPEIFEKKESGTKIIITKLRIAWTRKRVRECCRAITSLNSPFQDKTSFKATLNIDNKDWIKGLLDFNNIKKYKLFEFSICMEKNEITEFNYKFIPWSTMPKLKVRHITKDNKEIKSVLRMVYKDKETREYQDIDLSKHKIGPVQFKGVIFDRDARVLELGVQDKSGLKKYLDANGGIRVFRDNMRVLDYGEPGNDWLDLGGRRVNVPTKRISNNIIIGGVFLNRAKSSDLKEKANREGFLEDDAYDELVKAVLYAIDKLETFRKTDKDLLRKYYGPQKNIEPVITSIAELKDIVEKNVKEKNVQNTINVYLDRIEQDYERITESLIKSAGAGLNLIVVIHQIEKIIKDIKAALKSKAVNKSILGRVEDLASLVEGYSILIKNSEKKERNLKGIINQSLFNTKFRFEAHGINVRKEYESKRKGFDAICSEGHVLNALMNLFDNSIWWLGYSKTKNPEIYIDVSDAVPGGYVSIIIADNGPGFSMPVEELTKPFVSNKPGGMGIGLHLTNEIMKSLKGRLVFDVEEYFDIPSKYKNGAVIALAFKKEEK